jgi:periplasmic protein TonB
MTVVAFSDPISRQRSRWFGAATTVVALHVCALALAIIGIRNEVLPEEPEGSVMLELSPVPLSAAMEAVDMPPGPVVETAELVTPKVLEPVPMEDEFPELEASPLAPEPEVELPQLRPVEQPSESKEPEPEMPTLDDPAPAQELVIPQVTAPPPTIAMTPAPETAAQKQGTTTNVAQHESSWQKQIVTQLGKHRRYPQEARARRHQGDVMVKFTVDRGGRVLSSAILQSSGSSHLDAEALAVIDRAAPLPEPPEDLAGERFDLELPIRFRIKGE